MKTLLSLIFPLFLPFSPPEQKGVENFNRTWSTPSDLDVPESVIYDEEREALYVSNIDGEPLEKNGEGYLSKLTLEGEIGDLKWITGLNAPKGMALYKDTLYVSDIDRLVAVSMKHGKVVAEYPEANAEFLNDVTISPDGQVFVSDMKRARIHVLENGKLKTWKEGEDLQKVNGLYWHKGTLYAGTADRILAIDPKARTATTVVEGTPSVDGLIAGVKGGFLFSDWKGRVFFSEPGGEPSTLSDTRDDGRNAADIGYIHDEGRVLVPTFFDNRVFAYDIQWKEE